MGANFAVVSGTIPTTETTKSFTRSGYGTAEAAIVTCITTNSARGCNISIGFTDGTDEVSIAWNSEDAQSKSDNGHGIASNLVNNFEAGGGSKDEIVGVFSQWVTDGIEIDFTTVSGGTDSIQVLLIGGSDVSAKVGYTTCSGASHDETGVGFQPDVVFGMISGSLTSMDSGANGISLGYGFAHYDGVSTYSNAGINVYEENAASTTNVRQRVSDSKINGNTIYLNTFDANGFTVQQAAPYVLLWLALKFPSNDSHVGVYQTKGDTGTGTHSYTGTGFTPQWCLLLTALVSALDTTELTAPYNETAGMSSWTSSWASVKNAMITDNVGTTDTISQSYSNAMYLADADFTFDIYRKVADHESWDSNGFTLDYTFNGSGSAARYVPVLLVEEDTAAPTIHGTILGGGLTPQLRS